MSKPISQPVSPAQPNQAIYGLSALQLFRDFSATPGVKPRDAYSQAFGVQAPNWDPSRPAQYWFDSTVDASNPANVAIYEDVVNRGGMVSIEQVQYPAIHAATVNMPGLNTYPPYIIAPTAAKIAGNPMNPALLSDQQDALNLAAELGLGASTVIDGTFQGVFTTDYEGDTRRMWAIMYGSVAMFAGELLQQKYAKGIGHPGTWQLTSAGAVWTPAADGPDGITTGQPTTVIPVPKRGLLPNEKIQETLMGACIARTDMQSIATDAGGSFTAADRATLAWVQQKLTSLFGS